MADDEATGDVTPSGDPTAPGARRATYTPPVGDDGMDDDALADALAAEFARINASGPIPIVPPAQQTPPPLNDVVEDVAAPDVPGYEPPAFPDYPASAPVTSEDASNDAVPHVADAASADEAPEVGVPAGGEPAAADAAPIPVESAPDDAPPASDDAPEQPSPDAPAEVPTPAWEPVAWEPPAPEEPRTWEPPVAETPVWHSPEPEQPETEQPEGEQPAAEAQAEQSATEQPAAEQSDGASAPEAPPAEDAPAAEPAQPAWMNAPAPDPSQAVDLPEGPPERPVRRSLPDEQLAGWVDDAAKEGGTLSVIEELEAQLKLREQEAREFQEWEQTMRAVGTPDAISEVEEARPEFTGVLPDGQLATAPDDSLAPAPGVVPEPAPAPEFAPEPQPESEVVSELPTEPEPEPEQRLEPQPQPEAGPQPEAEPGPQPQSQSEPQPEPEPQPQSGPEPAAAPEPPSASDAEELYRPPTGWFIPAPIDDAPTMQFSDAPAEDVAAPETDGTTDAAGPAEQDVPVPVTGTFVLPEQPLAAWPAPKWDDPDEAPAQSDDVATGDVPMDAAPVWNLDDLPSPAPEPASLPEPVSAPEQPAEPEPAPEPEGFFLPEPAYEPLHPTHPVETISRGDRVEPTVADAAAPAAPPPFAPPPLVEPPPLNSGMTGDVAPLGVAPVDVAPLDAALEAPVDGLVPNPAPEIAQQDGFPLGEQFFPSPEVEAAPSSFDDLLAGSPDAGEPVGVDREPERQLPAESLFIEPLPASAHEPAATTGSVTIIDQAYQEEIDDDVDETDRVVQMFGPVSVDTAGIAVVPPAISPPSGPISTVRIREDEAVLAAAPPKQKVFTLEATGPEPTPAEYRVGKAARLFWLWFASNSSMLSIGLGAAVFGLGLSLSQSVVAIFAGVVLSFIPLGLSTLAGKRSAQPTMIVSRATFGLLGNTAPAVLALVTRLFWGAVLLWFLASSVAVVLVGAELNGSLSERQLLLIGLAGGLAIALLVAFFGYALLARLQLVITIVSGVLVLGLIGFTWQYVDIAQALTNPYGSWELVVTGAVLVFSFVGLVWAHSAGDLARYQHPESSGAATMLWSTFGVTVPAFVLIAYGALLAASNEGVASGFLLSPLDTLALMLPSWYPIPLLAATVLSLLSGITVSLYSGGFALQAIGVRVPRPYSVPIVAVLLAGLTLVVTFAVPGGNLELFRDGATTLAVPVAAWAGIFSAELMLRKRRFENQSLLQRGGVYPDVRWLNLIALIVISAIGFGLTTATVTWLSWQGYVFGLLAVPIDSALAGTDLGVIVALLLGLLVPIVAGVPGIRRQEATEV